MVAAVLTGDIVNSTKLSANSERKLLKNLKGILSSHTYEFYRGDSFQVYLKQGEEALRIALLCRTAAISIAPAPEMIAADIRISIGIGAVKAPVINLASAKGEAFVLSGRLFDELEEKNVRLAIAAGSPVASTGLEVIADYINAIFGGMTDKQAAVIYQLLTGKSQKEVTAKLNKSKSTIHQHVMSGRWYEIEKLLRQFENIVTQLK